MKLAFRAQPTLARTIFLRLAAVAFVTLVVQVAYVTYTNYTDYDSLYVDHVTYEAQSLAKGLKAQSGVLSFSLPPQAKHYRDERRSAYAFRIRDAKGTVIASENAELIDGASPWSAGLAATPDYWFRQFDRGGRFDFAGGRRLKVGNADVWIEMATLGDPAGIHWVVVANDTVEDVLVPIIPFAIFIQVIALLTVRHSLNPLAHAAARAELISPADVGQRFDLAGLPREAAAFASAINRMMARVAAAISTQKVFIASAAHELRTPLAVMLLELGQIDHPRARRLETDVASMSNSVDHLLLLARFDTAQPLDVANVNLGKLIEEAIECTRVWASSRHHEVEVVHVEPCTSFRADPVAISEASRNLVENAVRHTPEGSLIRVTVGPGPRVSVEDSGPGLPPDFSDQWYEPFRKGNSSVEGAGLGLAIARRAAELHGGSIAAGRSPLGGAMFVLSFAASPAAVASQAA